MPRKDLDHYLKKLKKIERKIKESKRKKRKLSTPSDDETTSRPSAGSSATDYDSEIDLTQDCEVMNIDTTESLPAPSASTAVPDEVLVALGDLMPEKPAFGPEINVNLARIWQTILKNGLGKDKQKIMDQQLIPQNCQLLKAPKLNMEVATTVTDNIVNRDKKIEIEQNQLGMGLSLLGNALSSLIDNEVVDRMKLISMLSDAGRIFTDLHNMQTRSRKNLIFPVLDKKFLETVKDVERDEFLYGTNLLERIKSLQTVQRSGQSIKKPTTVARQGNLSGPPRSHHQRHTARQGQRRQASSQGKYRPYQSKKPKPTAEPKPAARR